MKIRIGEEIPFETASWLEVKMATFLFPRANTVALQPRY
jgi:hypothetical protein